MQQAKAELEKDKMLGSNEILLEGRHRVGEDPVGSASVSDSLLLARPHISLFPHPTLHCFCPHWQAHWSVALLPSEFLPSFPAYPAPFSSQSSSRLFPFTSGREAGTRAGAAGGGSAGVGMLVVVGRWMGGDDVIRCYVWPVPRATPGSGSVLVLAALAGPGLGVSG